MVEHFALLFERRSASATRRKPGCRGRGPDSSWPSHFQQNRNRRASGTCATQSLGRSHRRTARRAEVGADGVYLGSRNGALGACCPKGRSVAKELNTFCTDRTFQSILPRNELYGSPARSFRLPKRRQDGPIRQSAEHNAWTNRTNVGTSQVIAPVTLIVPTDIPENSAAGSRS